MSVSLLHLAERINAAHEAYEGGSRQSIHYAFEAGESLVQARELVAHGEWLPWLKRNFRGSRQTADIYIRVAGGREYLESNCQRVGNLSLRSAVKILIKASHANGVGPCVASLGTADCDTAGAVSVDKLDTLIVEGRKFGTIYADPPWQYSNQGTRASTDNHYPTMTPEQLAALPVRELAAERSHLWLWTTNGFLFECPRLFDAWGFEFKSSYVWVKPQIGIGNYLRNAHELLLLAVRGGLVGAARDVRSWGQFDRGKHSAKPETIRKDVVERLSPGPRLEMFGRRLVDGWTVWGNQIERTMFDAEAA